MRVAALTMAYNEPVWAPVWARYYASQVGEQNCFVLDHGSDDRSMEGLGVRVERLARSPLDETWRAAVIGERVAFLLRSYDAVVHSDVDELVIADPAAYSGLLGFARGCGDPVVTTIGLDLQHLMETEGELDLSRPIGTQRRWVRFSGAMCKPAFVRRRVTWTPGFHGADARRVIRGLYLVHLRYADLTSGLARLVRSRSHRFATPDTNPHQRVSDEAYRGMMAGIAGLPRERFTMDATQLPLRRWLERLPDQGDIAAVASLSGDRLWRLPPRVCRLF